MAIEFNCPYCTATVRVGDEASGKIGRCPKCDTRVRVPTIPVGGAPAPVPPIQSESSNSVNAPVPSQPVATGPVPLFPDLTASSTPRNPGELPVVPVTDDPVTSKYIKRRKKKKVNYASWIAPVIFGGILVAIGLFYYNSTKPSYEGTLAAERINPNQSIQIELEGEAFNIDQQVFSQIVDELRKSPSSIRSNLVNLTFAAGANGIEMTLRPGIQAELVKVPVTNMKSVEDFYQIHFDELDDARLDEIQRGLKSLAEEWVLASEGAKNETLPNYRNSVAYNAFVKGLGRIVFAQIGKAMYPCVHEDGSGALYFLVPIGTETFTIRERSELDETPVFPSEFNIQATIERPKLATPEMVPVEPEAGTEIETQAEPIPYEAPPGADGEESMDAETMKPAMSGDMQNMMNK